MKFNFVGMGLLTNKRGDVMVAYNEKNKKEFDNQMEEAWRQVAIMLAPKMKEMAEHIIKCNEQLCILIKELDKYKELNGGGEHEK